MVGLINEWRVIGMTKKISIVASICTILGLFISIYSSFVSSSEMNATQNINGAGSILVGNNSGSVTIYNNQKNNYVKHLILKNASSGGFTGVISEPDISVAADRTKIVCEAIAGTSVSLTGKTATMFGMPRWKEISILDGECVGKVGWVDGSNLTYE